MIVYPAVMCCAPRHVDLRSQVRTPYVQYVCMAIQFSVAAHKRAIRACMPRRPIHSAILQDLGLRTVCCCASVRGMMLTVAAGRTCTAAVCMCAATARYRLTSARGTSRWVPLQTSPLQARVPRGRLAVAMRMPACPAPCALLQRTTDGNVRRFWRHVHTPPPPPADLPSTRSSYQLRSSSCCVGSTRHLETDQARAIEV